MILGEIARELILIVWARFQFVKLVRRQLSFVIDQYGCREEYTSTREVILSSTFAKLQISFRKEGPALLLCTAWLNSPKTVAGALKTEIGLVGPFYLNVIVGALTGVYPPPQLTMTPRTPAELRTDIDRIAGELKEIGRALLENREDTLTTLLTYQQKRTVDYNISMILEAVGPALAEAWRSKSPDELTSLYKQWHAAPLASKVVLQRWNLSAVMLS